LENEFPTSPYANLGSKSTLPQFRKTLGDSYNSTEKNRILTSLTMNMSEEIIKVKKVVEQYIRDEYI